VAWAGVACFALGCGAANTNASRFGFTGPEIFPIENLISGLNVADLDGDGLNDIIVANNARSRLSLLYNQTGQTNSPAKPRPTAKLELNELPPDARFRIESIASEKRIFSLVVEDLDGDGRPDIAYYGEPRELVVVYDKGTNGWSAPRRWPLDDGQLSANGLCAGDLNADARTDLVLLGETCLYFLAQQKDHTLGEPRKIPFSGAARCAQVVDIDGDGLSDLLLVNWDDRNPFRFRLQQRDGELGPEIYFPSTPIRSYWAESLEANKKTQVITIAQNSGRAQISEFNRKPAEALAGSLRQGQFQVIPLKRTDRARRGLLWADVSGDGLPDLIFAEPESGQISVCFQNQNGALGPAKTFPTLAGVSDLTLADWDDDGQPELFMLSADERQVGVARLDEKQRLPFPTLIPLDGRPLAIAAGSLQAGTNPVLAVIVEQEGRGGFESRRVLVTRTAEGKTRNQRLSRDFKSNPTVLAFHDADQDGLADLVALIPYEKIKVLRQVAGKDFEEVDVALPGGALEQPWLTSADIDGDGKPELLLPQKNFLRAVVLRREARQPNTVAPSEWTFTVKEQINGAGSNSRLVGAAAIPAGTNTIPSLFLLDAERKALTLCERDRAGVWQVVRNVPLAVSDFSQLQPAQVGGSGTNALVFLGLNAVACMPFSGQTWELTELDSYETPIKGGRLTDVVSGDLDNDGRQDLVFLETARNYLDLVIFDAKHKLIPANRWQVFEERTFRSRRNDFPEPREAVVADVTGDGKNDLIVLVHDRILVYPQE